MGETDNMSSDWGKLAGNSEMDRIFVFMKSNGPIALSTVGLNTFKWPYISNNSSEMAWSFKVIFQVKLPSLSGSKFYMKD